MKNLLSSWGMLVVSVLFNVFGVFVIKLKLNEYGAIPVDSFKAILTYILMLLKSPLVLIGVVLFFLSPVLYMIALSRMEMAIAYTAQIGLNYAFILILALTVLGEQLTLHKIIGVILIFAGIYFLNKQ